MTPHEVETSIALIERRLDSHSRYIANEVMPLVEDIRREMGRLWVSDKRFRKLEQAVAGLHRKLERGPDAVRQIDPFGIDKAMAAVVEEAGIAEAYIREYYRRKGLRVT